ncbi:MAG TPA: ABC transporter substrate-binding protein [Chromatiales bacterium]|nr:ABC transporter substrate-binding protein [Thiotrichales bacterium]HIP67780.1 ABC transporter substrate-binding protein [Chromatiales bacterium]
MKLSLKYLIFSSLFFIVGVSPVQAQEKIDKLILSGPFAAVSNPLIHMVESGALNDMAKEVEFVTWANPDQLRASVLGNKADFIAMPSNVAANLYNRGVKLKLLNISVWGVLWMVSREDGLQTLADFKGKEIAMPFRADMPDIVFSQLAKKQGLDPKKDFNLRYVSNPLDAMQLLIMRRVDHALLAEPAISMALRKTKSFPVKIIAPDLYRSVDLQQEWGRLFERESQIPQAGMVALEKTLKNPALIKRVNEEYARSLQWCLDNPEKAGEMVAKYIDLLTPEAVTDSLGVTIFKSVKASEAKPELEFFFKQMMEETPALVGGKLPDDAFYFEGS